MWPKYGWKTNSNAEEDMLDSYWVKKWASDAYRQEAEDLARLDPYWVKKYARDGFGEEDAEDLARLDPYWVKKYARDRFGEEELWSSIRDYERPRGLTKVAGEGMCTSWRRIATTTSVKRQRKCYKEEAEDLARLDPYWVKKYARDRFGEEDL